MPRLLWRSWGGGAVSYERGTPAGSSLTSLARADGPALGLHHTESVYKVVLQKAIPAQIR